MRLKPLLTVFSFLGLFMFSAQSMARNGNFYFQVAPGYGTYTTEDLVIDKSKNLPVTNFAPNLQMGLNLFGYAGVFGELTAFGWDIASGDIGGGGFLGGGIRVLPLELLQFLWPHVWPDMPLIPTATNPDGVTWHDRPFELGLYWGTGYHMLGEEYAYEGDYSKWGFDLQYFVTDTFAVGLDFPFYYPTFDAVRITDWEDNYATCVDGANFDSQYRDGNIVSTFPKDQAGDRCTGVPPQGAFNSINLTITMLADFGI